MIELALRTKEFFVKKKKYTAWKPKGSVIVVIDRHILRNKWLEIVCDLVSPKKRNKFKNIPGWQYLCDHWTSELWEHWFDLCKPTEQYPLGSLMDDPNASQTMWDKDIDPALITILGKEPNGIENLTNTWLWSEFERKIYFIITNTDETVLDTIKSWVGVSENYLDELLYISPKMRVKYDTELSLSLQEIELIDNPNIIVHPKFDEPVEKIYINETNLGDL